MGIIEAWIGQTSEMHVFGIWVQLKPQWLIILVSVASVVIGILLRQYLPRQKILAILLPLIVFLTAEYVVGTQRVPGSDIVWVTLGSCSALLALGVALPSVLTCWNVRLKDN